MCIPYGLLQAPATCVNLKQLLIFEFISVIDNISWFKTYIYSNNMFRIVVLI